MQERISFLVVCSGKRSDNHLGTLGWYHGKRRVLEYGFDKIIWTDKKTVGKQTVAVVGITVVLGVIISVLDSAVLEFVNLLIK